MKKIISTLLIAYCLLLIAGNASAATPTPTKTPLSSTPTPKTSNTGVIGDLKDRIASRVAQLKLVERRGIIGTVSEVADTQLTLMDLQNNTRFVDVDELTKFSSPSAKGEFGISDIAKGTQIGVLGLYNKQSRRLLARFVEVMSMPKTIDGVIAKKDEENFTITVMSEDGKTTLVDIESITRTSSYTKSTGLIKAGFTKVKTGQPVLVTGFADVKDKTRLIGSRIVVFPELPKNPKITVADKALMDKTEPSPSTGSGKKLTPITR